MNDEMEIAIDDEVRTALNAKRAVVALESTIFSHLGLPSPANREALDRCLNAIRGAGATPAITAVIDGVARVVSAPTNTNSFWVQPEGWGRNLLWPWPSGGHLAPPLSRHRYYWLHASALEYLPPGNRRCASRCATTR